MEKNMKSKKKKKEYWSGVPFPPPVGLPHPEIEPKSAESPALADRFFPTVPPGEPSTIIYT